jgi:flagellar protein FliO/FliZ
MSARKAGPCPTRALSVGERRPGLPVVMRPPLRPVTTALLAAWLPAWASAAEPMGPQSSSWGALLQALLALLVVLAALFAFLWLLRRISPVQAGAQGAVRVVGGVMLGTRERLVIVEVADQWLLIGVAPGQVSHLLTLPKPAGYDAPAEGGAPAGFAAKLAEILGRHQRR